MPEASIHAASCATDPGRRRSVNQDACYVDIATRAFLVADGMGGAAAGEHASGLFRDTVIDLFGDIEGRAEQQHIKEAFLHANAAIRAHVHAVPEHAGMGCTAELLTIGANGYLIGHVGDSRSYLFRAGELEQLTHDHSLVQDQIDRGILSAEAAHDHTLRNVILRAVGTTEQIEVDLLEGALAAGDIMLLCTDGLHALVSPEDIAKVLAFNGPPALKASMLIDLANHAGGTDNIAVTLIEMA